MKKFKTISDKRILQIVWLSLVQQRDSLLAVTHIGNLDCSCKCFIEELQKQIDEVDAEMANL